jgi:hypothetical protein
MKPRSTHTKTVAADIYKYRYILRLMHILPYFKRKIFGIRSIVFVQFKLSTSRVTEPFITGTYKHAYFYLREDYGKIYLEFICPRN